MGRTLGAAAFALAFPAATVAAQAPAMGWPEVIAALTTERSNAETCVGLLKSRGDPATLDKAKATYGMARADMDGVIAGLEAVLAEGRKPESLPNVRPSLETSANSLKQICAAAAATATPNTKGVWDGIAKGVAEGAIEPLINKIADGVAAIWNHYVVEPDKLALETRQSKLEAARWPDFGALPRNSRGLHRMGGPVGRARARAGSGAERWDRPLRPPGARRRSWHAYGYDLGASRRRQGGVRRHRRRRPDGQGLVGRGRSAPADDLDPDGARKGRLDLRRGDQPGRVNHCRRRLH